MARHATPQGQAESCMAREKPADRAPYTISWVNGVAGRGKCPFSQDQKPSTSGGIGNTSGAGGGVIASPPCSRDTQRRNGPTLEQRQCSASVGTLDIHWPAHGCLQGHAQTRQLDYLAVVYAWGPLLPAGDGHLVRAGGGAYGHAALVGDVTGHDSKVRFAHDI